MEYGFSSHAAFTRAFKEAYGISPEEYRKDWPMLNTCDKPELSMRYQLVDEVNITIHLKEKPEVIKAGEQ